MSHGLGSLKQDPRSGNWRARYWGSDGKQHCKTFLPNEKTKAKNFLAEQASLKAKGQWIDPRSAQTPFDSWAREWFAGKHKLGAAAKSRDGILLERHVISHFGKTPIGKIDAPKVKAWVNALVASGLSPHTIHPCVRMFKAVMRAAIDAKMISDAPIGKGIAELPPVRRKRERFLDEHQIERLAESIDPHYRVFVYTAAYTGCRWQELAGLKREYLDLDNGTLEVRGVLKRQGNGALRYEEEPKSESSRRVISLPAFLTEMLSAHLRGALPSVWVFPAKQGGMMQPTGFRKVWNAAVNKADLDPLHFHDLRHTHVALLIRDGVQAFTIQKRLGHRDISTTLGTYGHLFPNHELALVEQLDKRRRQAQETASKVVSING